MHAWSTTAKGWAILVHGGAGSLAAKRCEAAEAGCREAAERAAELLAAGDSALDAVQRAVEALEDDPRFNAGTGAALTSEGHLEFDAAVMDGCDLRAGSVCSLPPFQHPVAVARAVLREGVHVMYSGRGAERFAQAAGFTRADESSMIAAGASKRIAHAIASGRVRNGAGDTVGAVAIDGAGNLAAATSTGGTPGKRPGRVGDSPLIGVGTYADNDSGAISATGEGEAIMRMALCSRALAWLRDTGDPEAALCRALELMRQRVAGSGGLILVAPGGGLALARNTRSMPWAAAWPGGSESGC